MSIDWQPIHTAPIGRAVLILCDEGVIEAMLGEGEEGILNRAIQWHPIVLDCHGCGCCAGDYPDPTHWATLNYPKKGRTQ